MRHVPHVTGLRVSGSRGFFFLGCHVKTHPLYFIYLFCCRTHNPREGVVLVVLAIMVCSPFACVFLLLLLLLFHCGGSPRVNASVCRWPGFWPCQIAVNISKQFQFNNVKVFPHLLGLIPENVVNREADKLGICCTKLFRSC